MHYYPPWWMRVEIVYSLALTASSTDLNEFKLHTVYSGNSKQITLLQLVGQGAEFMFDSKVDDTAGHLAITPVSLL